MANKINFKLTGILVLLGVGGFLLFTLFSSTFRDPLSPVIDNEKFLGTPIAILHSGDVLVPSEVSLQEINRIENQCSITTTHVCSVANDLNSNKPQRIVCYCFQGV